MRECLIPWPTPTRIDVGGLRDSKTFWMHLWCAISCLHWQSLFCATDSARRSRSDFYDALNFVVDRPAVLFRCARACRCRHLQILIWANFTTKAFQSFQNFLSEQTTVNTDGIQRGGCWVCFVHPRNHLALTTAACAITACWTWTITARSLVLFCCTWRPMLASLSFRLYAFTAIVI